MKDEGCLLSYSAYRKNVPAREILDKKRNIKVDPTAGYSVRQ